MVEKGRSKSAEGFASIVPVEYIDLTVNSVINIPLDLTQRCWTDTLVQL